MATGRQKVVDLFDKHCKRVEVMMIIEERTLKVTTRRARPNQDLRKEMLLAIQMYNVINHVDTAEKAKGQPQQLGDGTLAPMISDAEETQDTTINIGTINILKIVRELEKREGIKDVQPIIIEGKPSGDVQKALDGGGSEGIGGVQIQPATPERVAAPSVSRRARGRGDVRGRSKVPQPVPIRVLHDQANPQGNLPAQGS